MDTRLAKFAIGQVVRHRMFPFRGVIFDVDPEFSNTEEWWLSIPEDVRPEKDQPFYHLLAENEQSNYVAYVSEQNLLPDETGEPVGSRTLSRRGQLDLSPATIRNVMSDLEDAGLLFAPHTSAGRLPTEAGLKLFVNGLLDALAKQVRK